MTVILNVCKYIFTVFVLGYGIFTAYEDHKSKEIHAFPIMIMSIINFFFCVLSQTFMPYFVGSSLIIMIVFLVFFDRVKLWGSGDTKMCAQGLIFATWWLKPQSIFGIIFIPVTYMLISSIIGLITIIIRRDKYPPMGAAFLITNVITLIFALCII